MIKVLGDRVLVALRPTPDEIVSDSGIVLMKDPDAIKTPTQGIVMALGQKIGTVRVDAVCACIAEECREAKTASEVIAAIKKLPSAPFDVELGDCVLFSRGAGDQITADGVDYVILFETDIIGVCEPLGEPCEYCGGRISPHGEDIHQCIDGGLAMRAALAIATATKAKEVTYARS